MKQRWSDAVKIGILRFLVDKGPHAFAEVLVYRDQSLHFVNNYY